MQKASLLLACLTTGLMAGLFYAYSYSVNDGLGRLHDQEYLTAMQSINRTIQNPVFFFNFFGAPLALPVSALLFYRKPDPVPFRLLMFATAVYWFGVMAVTMLGNIPLNEALDHIDLTTLVPEKITAQRHLFENPWNKLNAIRTFSSVTAFILVVFACMQNTNNATPVFP